MRIGLISDVHANHDALDVVLRALDRLKIDYLASLGDVVGYGAEPNVCCERVRAAVDVAVLGNHDAAVCGRMDYSYYRAAAREALDWHAGRLSDVNMEWLRSLPYIHRMGDVAFSHGSPLALEEFEYIFVREQMDDVIEAAERMSRVTFIGHSHLCKCFAFDRNDAEEVLNTRFELEPNKKYIITAGSVGQPRDYDPRACFGVYDSERGAFEYHRLPYNIEGAARKIFDVGLSVAFGKRLYLGV
ncbi:metallophosphatase family protein [Myxococcota bacterium]|nr:metallophosphatase family protein [Myxococcota bacterium]MBU1433294.1 metallophosphatase family protein [Myxococcota bacterium]MBU1896212.1 metallophosphatase family protein [Myxococcota bacterium]